MTPPLYPRTMRRPSLPFPHAMALHGKTATLHIPVKGRPPHLHRAPADVRPVVPHQNPEGRRVNVPAARAAPGTHRHAPLTWRTASHPWKGEQVLAFLRNALPGGAGLPRIVVFDNARRRSAKPGGSGRSRGSGCGACLPRSGAKRHRTHLPHRQARGHAPAHLHDHQGTGRGQWRLPSGRSTPSCNLRNKSCEIF